VRHGNGEKREEMIWIGEGFLEKWGGGGGGPDSRPEVNSLRRERKQNRNRKPVTSETGGHYRLKDILLVTQGIDDVRTYILQELELMASQMT